MFGLAALGPCPTDRHGRGSYRRGYSGPERGDMGDAATATGDVAAAAARFRATLAKLEEELGRIVVGQKDVVRQTIVAILAGGHVLLEGVPGLGKTLLCRSLAGALDMTFRRIQFTPDLM